MKGADELMRKLNALKEVKKDLADLIDDTLTDIEIAAIRDAPIGINQRISKEFNSAELTGKIQVNAGAIGAYVEFGTGASAAALVPTLPDEWQAMARTFFVNGKGKLHAKPYLYPNWARYTIDFKDKVLEIVKKAKDK